MSNKQKNIALLFGFLLLLFVSYLFSIQKTFELKSRMQELKKEKELVSNASERIFNLQQENKYLDAILQQKELSIENSFQQTLLQKLDAFSKTETIEIISFDEPHLFTENKTNLKTYSFKVKGNFKALLKLINTLEKQQLGKIISINFEKKKNYRRNKEELTGQFYIQKRSQPSRNDL
ncbi:MAG: hypothetical protein ACWIPJ_04435 [Polaribacter sp.]